MTVGIIGLGYVGLPLAVAFAEKGHEVVGVDSDLGKLEALRAGSSYIEDIASERLAAVAQRIEPTSRYARLARADAVIICVPTPLSANREPDLSPLVDCGRSLSEVLRAGQVVVLESTTYPGTTRERLVPLLEASGLVAGRDFHLAFSPERVDPGRIDYTLSNTPKVLGGLTPACGDRAEALYRTICDTVVRVSTPEAAELTKLLENIFRSVNIAPVNELAIVTLLDSPATARSVILVHDTMNAEIRSGIESLRLDDHPKIVYYEPDFVPGYVYQEGECRGAVWGVLACSSPTPAAPRPIRADLGRRFNCEPFSLFHRFKAAPPRARPQSPGRWRSPCGTSPSPRPWPARRSAPAPARSRASTGW